MPVSKRQRSEACEATGGVPTEVKALGLSEVVAQRSGVVGEVWMHSDTKAGILSGHGAGGGLGGDRLVPFRTMEEFLAQNPAVSGLSRYSSRGKGMRGLTLSSQTEG